MKLSIVIPVYNGAETIEELVRNVEEELSPKFDLEIVLVNDGSLDESEEVCGRIALNDAAVRFISLRKNFGEHNAVMCGLNHVSGDAAVIIDDDFQNPPREIVKLVDKLEQGYDVIYSRYAVKRHSFMRNVGSRINDFAATWLTGKPRHLYLSSFKAIRRGIIDEITKYKGPFPYIDGLILRVTSNIETVPVEHDARRAGRSNYTWRTLVSLYLNMFLNFSMLPLRIFTLVGVGVFAAGFLLSLTVIFEKYLSTGIPAGYASVFVAVFILGGIQIVFIGLLGEFLGKQYLDQNGTPQWVIKKKVP